LCFDETSSLLTTQAKLKLAIKGRNPLGNSIINPPSCLFSVTHHRLPTPFPHRFVRSLGFVPIIFQLFSSSPVSSVNILRSSSRLSVQADCVSPSDRCLPRGQLNLSASHSISAVIRHIIYNKHTQPNAFGARIVVPSRLNLPAWQAGLTDYHDSEVALFLTHGWPVNYCLSSDPIPVDTNHSSAVNFAQTVDSFIATELSHEATAGPFKHDPIPSRLQTSPLQTVDKDKTKSCIVLDLSFPPGRSINDGIPKDTFLDVPFHLTLPRSADFVISFPLKALDLFCTKKTSNVHIDKYLSTRRTTSFAATNGGTTTILILSYHSG